VIREILSGAPGVLTPPVARGSRPRFGPPPRRVPVHVREPGREGEVAAFLSFLSSPRCFLLARSSLKMGAKDEFRETPSFVELDTFSLVDYVFGASVLNRRELGVHFSS